MTAEPSSQDQNPEPAGFRHGVDDTLGGYLAHHNRPPAFQGSDGHPYTVSPEVERTPNLPATYAGFLVFPRWAQTGAGIMGHLETPTLLEEASMEDARRKLGALSLQSVKVLLEEAILRKNRKETA
jgi:hypothetical protein